MLLTFFSSSDCSTESPRTYIAVVVGSNVLDPSSFSKMSCLPFLFPSTMNSFESFHNSYTVQHCFLLNEVHGICIGKYPSWHKLLPFTLLDDQHYYYKIITIVTVIKLTIKVVVASVVKYIYFFYFIFILVYYLYGSVDT